MCSEGVAMSDLPSRACGCDVPHPSPLAVPPTVEPGAAAVCYRIDNMDCPTEEALIRGKLASVPGILGLDFNLLQRQLTVRHNLASLEPVERALAAIGMRAVRQESDQLAEPVPDRTRWWALGAALLAAIAAEAMYWVLGGHHWLVILLALGAILT